MNKTVCQFLSGVYFISITSACTVADSEREFIKSELHGTLIKVQDEKRDVYTLFIKNDTSSKVLEYSLFIGNFVEENDIKENDSVSKGANSHSILFYKKKNGKYQEPIELYYE